MRQSSSLVHGDDRYSVSVPVPSQGQIASTLPGLIALVPVGQAGKPESVSLGCLAAAARLARELWNLGLSRSCTDTPRLRSLQD